MVHTLKKRCRISSVNHRYASLVSKRPVGPLTLSTCDQQAGDNPWWPAETSPCVCVNIEKPQHSSFANPKRVPSLAGWWRATPSSSFAACPFEPHLLDIGTDVPTSKGHCYSAVKLCESSCAFQEGHKGRPDSESAALINPRLPF